MRKNIGGILVAIGLVFAIGIAGTIECSVELNKIYYLYWAVSFVVLGIGALLLNEES